MAQGQLESKSSLSATRREMLGYAQVAALVLLLAAAGFGLLQAMVLQPEWIDLGPVDALKRDIPTVHTVTRRDKTTLAVWVVYTPGTWLVFDGLTPFFGPDAAGAFSGHCLYQWQPVTGRFEDPCTGYKFSRTGEFVDSYHQFVGNRVQDLDQFAPSLRDGHLFIDANRLIHSEPYVEPGS